MIEQTEGLSRESLQIHGPSRRYQGFQGPAWAWFGEQPTAEIVPAIGRKRVGMGRIVSFAYNLPWSIALTRQGNPRWANQENDGVPGLRPNDMFLHNDHNWIDPERVSIPQADEQMHLLVRIVEQLLEPEAL